MLASLQRSLTAFLHALRLKLAISVNMAAQRGVSCQSLLQVLCRKLSPGFQSSILLVENMVDSWQGSKVALLVSRQVSLSASLGKFWKAAWFFCKELERSKTYGFPFLWLYMGLLKCCSQNSIFFLHCCFWAHLIRFRSCLAGCSSEVSQQLLGLQAL